MPAKRPAPRLAVLDEAQMNEAQRALMEALRSGPRGKAIVPRGPFAAWLHAPQYGQLAQALGAHCRYKTALPPRLSEFAILCTARLWRAQYEWFAHEPMAEKAGVSPQDHQGPARRPRAEIGAQGRARDLRFRAGALQDAARRRPHLQTRARAFSATPPWSNWSASSATT